MEQNKDLEISIKDYYGENCLKDSVNKGFKRPRSPQGLVEIYEVDETGNKKLVRKSNLVVYSGREWLASRAVKLNNTSITATYAHFICWFGLGSGGVLPADPLDPISPSLTDVELGSPIMVGSSATYADYHTAGDTNPNIPSWTYPEDGQYKLPLDSVEFEQDPYNDDKWLITKFSITVNPDDANGKVLSECGLYTASTADPGHTGPFVLFSRATFPSIVKTIDRRLLFTWYLYF